MKREEIAELRAKADPDCQKCDGSGIADWRWNQVPVRCSCTRRWRDSFAVVGRLLWLPVKGALHLVGAAVFLFVLAALAIVGVFIFDWLGAPWFGR